MAVKLTASARLLSPSSVPCGPPHAGFSIEARRVLAQSPAPARRGPDNGSSIAVCSIVAGLVELVRIAITGDIDQIVSLLAPGAQKEGSIAIDLWLRRSRHDFKAAFSALPHGHAPKGKIVPSSSCDDHASRGLPTREALRMDTHPSYSSPSCRSISRFPKPRTVARDSSCAARGRALPCSQ